MPWSACTTSCGSGFRTRSRECSNGLPGSEGCEGLAIESTDCLDLNRECPHWLLWTEWSACSRTCSDGIRTRSRRCSNGLPGVIGCEGPTSQELSCNLQVYLISTFSLLSNVCNTNNFRTVHLGHHGCHGLTVVEHAMVELEEEAESV